MTDKKMLPVVILDLVGIIIGIAANAYVAIAGELSVLQSVNLWVNVAALLSSLVYLVLGYKKNAAVFYKLFASAFALSQFVSILSLAKENNYLGLSCYAVLFALILMLALVADMGKKKTFIICFIILILGVFLLVINFFSSPGNIINTGDWLLKLVCSFSVIVMAAVMWLMATAKYLDKDARKGTEE